MPWRCLWIVPLLLMAVSCTTRPENTVAMTVSRRFDPEDLEVKVGQTVTWVNDSSEAHTVTALQDEIPSSAEYFSSGGFSSQDEARSNLSEGLVTEGEEFKWTFEEPGIYRYYCIPHQDDGMQGTIEVVPARE
jgi:plastocyanin